MTLFSGITLAGNTINIRPDTGFAVALGKITFSGLIQGLIQFIIVIAAIIFFFMLLIGGVRWIFSGGRT